MGTAVDESPRTRLVEVVPKAHSRQAKRVWAVHSLFKFQLEAQGFRLQVCPRTFARNYTCDFRFALWYQTRKTQKVHIYVYIYISSEMMIDMSRNLLRTHMDHPLELKANDA